MLTRTLLLVVACTTAVFAMPYEGSSKRESLEISIGTETGSTFHKRSNPLNIPIAMGRSDAVPAAVSVHGRRSTNLNIPIAMGRTAALPDPVVTKSRRSVAYGGAVAIAMGRGAEVAYDSKVTEQ